jgi:hypothetical protein
MGKNKVITVDSTTISAKTKTDTEIVNSDDIEKVSETALDVSIMSEAIS